MTYIRKTIDFYISNELKALLEVISSQSKVAQLLLKTRLSKDETVENPVNFISISSQDKNKISYLTVERYEKLIEQNLDNFWDSSTRFHSKPGVFVGKLFKNIDSKEIELFSNLFKSESNKEIFKFKIVKGSEIKDYYHYSKYVNDRGTLGVSCMKHDSSQKLLNIYSDNLDNVSMLVMLNNEDLLMGRSLLWDFESYKIMDRIYTIDDEKLQLHFKKWATENGYLYKSEQNWFNTLFFENLKVSKKELKLDLKLKNIRYMNYPYMDTFKFYDTDNVTLHNYIPSGSEVRTLCSTDGSLLDSDYLRFDSLDKVFRYRGESRYLDYLDIYTHEKNIYWSDINQKYILREDAIYDEEIGDYIFNEKYDRYNNKEKIEYYRKNNVNFGTKQDLISFVTESVITRLNRPQPLDITNF